MEINFDPNKRFVLIHGANGSGKSTIVDAMDLVCNQCGGSVMERSQTKVKDHLPTIGCSEKDISVSVHSNGKSWSAKLSGSTITTTPADGVPSITVLRRGKILALIEATPSERFNQLKSFIDVEQVQKSEEELGKAIADSKKTSKNFDSVYSAAHLNLSNAYLTEHTKEEEGMTPEEWGKKRSEADMAVVNANLKVLKDIKDCYSELKQLVTTRNQDKETLDKKRVGTQKVK